MLVCLNPYRFPNSIAISETMIVGAARQRADLSLCVSLDATRAFPNLKGFSS
jgi:hypothetical protein